MNSSLTSLYRKGQPDCNTPTKDAAADPGPRSSTTVSTGGWFIDKSGCPEKSDLDPSEEQPGNKRTSVRSNVINVFIGRVRNRRRWRAGLNCMWAAECFSEGFACSAHTTTSLFCHQLAKASEPEKLHAEFKRKATAFSGAKSGTTQKGSSLADIVPSLCLMPVYL